MKLLFALSSVCTVYVWARAQLKVLKLKCINYLQQAFRIKENKLYFCNLAFIDSYFLLLCSYVSI